MEKLQFQEILRFFEGISKKKIWKREKVKMDFLGYKL